MTPDCISVADHLVGLAIDGIQSPTERATQAAGRARHVRETAEVCTRTGWSPALLRCYSAATTQAEAGACGAPS